MILGLSNAVSDVPSSLLVTEISAEEKKPGLVEDLSLERNMRPKARMAPRMRYYYPFLGFFDEYSDF